MCGAMLEAFIQNMVILIDGFIATSVFLAAEKINPKIRQNAIFCHESNEKDTNSFEKLNAKPILNLGLRLRRNRCAVAYPIIKVR